MLLGVLRRFGRMKCCHLEGLNGSRRSFETSINTNPGIQRHIAGGPVLTSNLVTKDSFVSDDEFSYEGNEESPEIRM